MIYKNTLLWAYFSIYHNCLKFDNNNAMGIFVSNNIISLQNIEVQLDFIIKNNFKLEVALVNKGWLCITLQNQLPLGMALT